MNKLKGLFKGTVLKDGGVVPKTEGISFAAGVAGQNVTYNLVSGWYFYFCSVVAGYDLKLLAIIPTITKVWDAVNDPLMGVLLDRHRFKNGEKLRPWLKYISVFPGICALLMFVKPGFTEINRIVQAVYLFIVYLIFDMCYTVQDISMWGMTAVMSPVSEERGLISQFGRIGSTVGSWLPGLISLMISFFGNLGVTERKLFAFLGIFMGFGGMVISTLASTAKERVLSTINVEETKLRENLLDLFKNRTVMCVLIGSILSGFSLSLPANYFFKYMVEVNIGPLHWDGMTANFILGLVGGIPGTLILLFAHPFAKKVGGMKNVMVIGYILPIFARIICYFIGYSSIGIIIVTIVLGIANMPGGLNGIAMTALFGDSVDYMEYKTGRRAEGVTFAAMTFCAKIGSAINNAVLALMLIKLNYNQDMFEVQGIISPEFTKWSWALYILGPIIGAVLNLIPVMFINYSEEQKQMVEAALKERRMEVEG